MDHQTTYISEGLIDPSGFDAFDHLIDTDVDREILDDLAIDVGEKYLDDIYSEDESGDNSTKSVTDSDHGGYSSDEAERPRQSIDNPMVPSAINDCRQATPSEADSSRLSLIVEEEDNRKQRGKEMAWQKVRQHLIEEEVKAATHKKPPTRSVNGPSQRSVRVDGYDTVKLLDSLTRLGRQDMSPPQVKYPSRTFIDRAGNKLSQFLHRGQVSAFDSTSTMTAWHPHPSFPFDSKSDNTPSSATRNRLQLLATLEQITLACQQVELSEMAMARISSHLTSIDEIMREDSSCQQNRGRLRRVSSTQWTTESSDCDVNCRDSTNVVLGAPLFTYPQTKVATTVRSSFNAFSAAQDLSDTLAAFNNLLTDCRLNDVKVDEPWYVYYHIKAAVYSKLGFRQKHLFKLLDARFNMDVYTQRPAANKRVCVVGAGPVGLRAAVELALLGSHVSVVEKRIKFSRENMLHLWPWVVQDMASLGAKVLFPKFCKSRTYFHVSTRQLQLVLLKVALLVGVKMHTSTDFEAIVPPQVEDNGGRPFYTVKTEPQIPEVEYTAVLGASGTNDTLAEPAGINRFVFCQKESLGIVCYFPNLETSEETKVKEFSWTAELKHKMLNKMREVGIDLENIVYFRGEMHYLVMTPKRHNLVVRGVVKKNPPRSADLVRPENINRGALHAFVNDIVKFVGIPRKAEFLRVSIFDFSALTHADKAASILTSHGKKLYVGLMGDSLLEPVWHEGVGTCRGFLSALDGVWMVAQIGKTADEQLLADREFTYRIMQRLSGHHRSEMQKNVRKYTVDPKSRYMVDYPCAP